MTNKDDEKQRRHDEERSGRTDGSLNNLEELSLEKQKKKENPEGSEESNDREQEQAVNRDDADTAAPPPPVGAFAVSGEGQSVRRGILPTEEDTETAAEQATATDDLSLMLSEAPPRTQNDDETPVLLEAQLAQPDEDLEAELSRRLQEELQDLPKKLPLVHAQVAKGTQNRKRLLFLIAVMLLIVVGVVVAVVVSTQKDSKSSSAPIETPTVQILNGTWSQIGQNLTGNATEDYYGTSVALSRDARVMAVGATQKYSHGDTRGYASVFELDESSSTQSAWIPKGQILRGEGIQAVYGRSVALNDNGSRLAVGALQKSESGEKSDSGYVRVYEYNVTAREWFQLGTDVTGDIVGDEFGISVSLSDTGDTLLVGARRGDTVNGLNSGWVRAYRYVGGSWEQVGQTLDGPSQHDLFGESVSMNRAGTIIAVGARSVDDGGKNAGQVSMFRYDSTLDLWVPMGEPLIGETGDLLGISVSLNDDGLIVAAGASKVDDEKVFVFAYDAAGEEWVQRGPTMHTRQPGDGFGYSVALNGEGDRLAVGSRLYNASGLTEAGHAVMLKYDINKGEWNQLGEGVFGRAELDRLGNSVTICGNGTIGIGSTGSDPNGDRSGSAFVFRVV